MERITPPSKKELEHLLFDQLLSKRKVAEYYSVSRPTISKWMKDYNIVNRISTELRVKKREWTLRLKQSTTNLNAKLFKINEEFLEEYEAEEELVRRETIAKQKGVTVNDVYDIGFGWYKV